jgi:hypothetical protein
MSADDNHESSSNALVPRPGTGLAETGRRTHPVLARMSRDLLARAEAQGLEHGALSPGEVCAARAGLSADSGLGRGVGRKAGMGVGAVGGVKDEA